MQRSLPAGVLRAEGHGARGRGARTWIIQHCPCVSRLVLGDIHLLLLEKSWDGTNTAR